MLWSGIGLRGGEGWNCAVDCSCSTVWTNELRTPTQHGRLLQSRFCEFRKSVSEEGICYPKIRHLTAFSKVHMYTSCPNTNVFMFGTREINGRHFGKT